MTQRLHPENALKVVLSGVYDDQQQDNNIDAPFVRVRNGNISHIYLDSSYTNSITPANIILGVNGGDLFTRRLNRIAVKGISMSWVTPNINPRNDTLTFSVGGSTYTTTMTDTYYDTVDLLFNSLASAMTSTSGTTFTATNTSVNVGVNSYILAATASAPFTIIGGNMVAQGQFMFGWIPTDSRVGVPVTSFILTNTSLQYTRFINLNSFLLTQYSKLPSSGIDTLGTNIVKVYLDNDLFVDRTIFFNILQPLAWINFNSTASITTVDLQIFDEWNQLLYIPPGFQNSFYVSIILMGEL